MSANDTLSAASSNAKGLGLDGVVVAETRLSHVDGERGKLIIAGHDVEGWAPRVTFEAAVSHLWQVAALAEAAPLAEELGRARIRAASLLPGLASALRLPDAMAALMAAAALLPRDSNPATVIGGLAVFAAAWARTRALAPIIMPSPERGHAADYLSMLGLPHGPAQTRALDTYLVTVLDHGLNASTFAVRVVASTGSDPVSATLAGIAALKGPLHGGAPGPVLDMLDAVPAQSPRQWLEQELGQGRRIMGMGHRIYRVRDPRAQVLERAVELFDRSLAAQADGACASTRARLAQARAVEREAEALLRERHPTRPLRANVEFYTAVLLEALGISRELFSATFALARAGGWLAHFQEQSRNGRLIRPASRYIGALPPTDELRA